MQQLTLGEPHHGPVTALVLRGNDLHAAIHGRVHTYDETGSLQRTDTPPGAAPRLACNEDAPLLAGGVYGRRRGRRRHDNRNGDALRGRRVRVERRSATLVAGTVEGATPRRWHDGARRPP